jgi:hypothetical protein
MGKNMTVRFNMKWEGVVIRGKEQPGRDGNRENKGDLEFIASFFG